MKGFRVGIIGTGGIARYAHIPVLKSMSNVEIVAICDILPERVAKINEEFALNARTFTDYKRMLDEVEMDSVHVLTPNYLHSTMSVEALSRGINVLCEKPDAVDVENARAMQEAQRASGKQLMVVRNNRFSDASAYLKKFIKRGDAGEIYAARCGWQRRRGTPGIGGWFTTKAQSGGGPLIDLGVHMIDLAIYLMGNPKPVSVSGSVYTKFANATVADSASSVFGDKVEGGTFDVEDLAMGFIKFDNGACLQVECSWASNIEAEKNFVELRGTKAGASWEGGKVKLFTEDEGVLFDITPTKLVEEGHKRNIAHYYQVLEGRAEPTFVIEQGINMLEVICGIYESARTGREVVLGAK